MKYTRFQDIPQFTPWGNYSVDVGLDYLEKQLVSMSQPDGLELDPDFQRAHVWSESQQVRYVEFVLRGGRSGKDILWNAPGWSRTPPKTPGPVVLVDGKQRLRAVQRFVRGEIRAFGSLVSQFTDRMRLGLGCTRFHFHVNDLQKRADVLQWYLDINAGGVVHTDSELNRVRDLLAEEKRK